MTYEGILQLQLLYRPARALATEVIKGRVAVIVGLSTAAKVQWFPQTVIMAVLSTFIPTMALPSKNFYNFDKK